MNTPFGPAKCATRTDGLEWRETCPALAGCRAFALEAKNGVSTDLFARFPALYQVDQKTRLSTCVVSDRQDSCRLACLTPCFAKLGGPVRAELSAGPGGETSVYEETLARAYVCPDLVQIGLFIVLPVFIGIVLLVWLIACCVKK